MKRSQMCVANVQYKQPSADGVKQTRNLLKYLTYRDSRDDSVQQRSGRERWVDHGMGKSVAEIAQHCADLRSNHVLMFSLVINPNPDLVAMVEHEQRERFVRELTENTVEDFFDARGIDTGIEYSYVVHHRTTDDPQAPGRHNPHTHIVVPGTVYSEDHGARVPLYFSRNKQVNHIDLLHDVSETEMGALMERYVGPDWEQQFDALEQEREQERRITEEPAHGTMRNEAGHEVEFWCGTRRQTEKQTELGYYVRSIEIDGEDKQLQFCSLIAGLPPHEAATLAYGLRLASGGDFLTYLQHIRGVQLMTAQQRRELCWYFDLESPDFESSETTFQGPELS